MSDQRWYPTEQQLKDPQAVERSTRQILKQHYALADKVAGAAAAQAASTSAPPVPANGPSNSKLLGLNVAPIDTSAQAPGSALSWNPTLGQIQFMPALALVFPPPLHSTSPGVPNQISYDSTHFYVCIALNSWVRATLAGGF